MISKGIPLVLFFFGNNKLYLTTLFWLSDKLEKNTRCRFRSKQNSTFFDLSFRQWPHKILLLWSKNNKRSLWTSCSESIFVCKLPRKSQKFRFLKKTKVTYFPTFGTRILWLVIVEIWKQGCDHFGRKSKIHVFHF